jgi:hypothetical protein
MPTRETTPLPSADEASFGAMPPGDPCLMVLFGASGDLTKRLLMPAIYNLACQRLLPEAFTIVGLALDDLSTEAFRSRMTEDIQKFSTRPTFDAKTWENLAGRLYYTPGNFNDHAAFRPRLRAAPSPRRRTGRLRDLRSHRGRRRRFPPGRRLFNHRDRLPAGEARPREDRKSRRLRTGGDDSRLFGTSAGGVCEAARMNSSAIVK